MFRLKSPISITNKGGQHKVVASASQRPQGGGRIGKRAELGTFNSIFGGGMQNSVSMSATGAQSKNIDSLLLGLVPEQNESAMRRIYRDIYYYDSVAGSCADLMSTLPFSDWSLGGADKKQLDVFQSSISRLNWRSILPEVSLEYLVSGAFLATLIFNQQRKVFTDIMPHDLDNCEIKQMPFYSMDPTIKVRNSMAVKNFVNSQDEFIARLRRGINPKLMEAMRSSAYTLDPITTVYLPRRVIQDANHIGTGSVSYFKRIVPYYLLEKTLFRGTLVEANKRQRATLHVQAGDDNWEPTPEELQALVALFQQGDLDPLGAIIATRNSIQASEIRQGGDFWKVNDILGDTTAIKLRALGISEAFLSGETTYATAEVGLSVFMESINAYRSMLTHTIFYNKLFPIIAVVNGFYKDIQGMKVTDSIEDFHYNINDNSKLVIPTINWHKSLNPRTDKDMIDMLTLMSEKGIPIPLRMWAASAGVTIESLINDLQDDQNLRQQIEKVAPNAGLEGAEGDTESMDFEGSGLHIERAALKRIGVINRKFPELATEVRGETKTGQKKWIPNQHRAAARENDIIVKAMRNIQQNGTSFGRALAKLSPHQNPYGVCDV